MRESTSAPASVSLLCKTMTSGGRGQSSRAAAVAANQKAQCNVRQREARMAPSFLRSPKNVHTRYYLNYIATRRIKIPRFTQTCIKNYKWVPFKFRPGGIFYVPRFLFVANSGYGTTQLPQQSWQLTLELCRFLKIRNCEFQFLFAIFKRNWTVRNQFLWGIDSKWGIWLLQLNQFLHINQFLQVYAGLI